jgi:hypothetical protein
MANLSTASDTMRVSGVEALRKTISWVRAMREERAGDSELVGANELDPACAQQLRAGLRCGAIAGGPGHAELSDILIDRGSLHAWLACVPIEDLTGALPPARARQGDGRFVSTLEAVQVACGERVGFAALEGSYARRAHERGWLADHYAGVGPLPDAIAEQIEVSEAEFVICEERRVASAGALVAAIVSGKRPAIARNANGISRPLTAQDFTSDIVLDFVSSKFAPHPDLPLGSGAWESARRVCDNIGEVFVAAADESRSRRIATAAAERRAEKRLRGLLERWLAAGGAMSGAPLKVAWVNGEGAQIAGSVFAAKRVWKEVVAEERFAKLRKGGRRPLEKRI